MKRISILLMVVATILISCKSTDITKNVKLISSYSQDTSVDDIETVKFGSYPQSDESGKTKEPIEWIVLDRQEDKSLLLSKYILDCKCYYVERNDATWEKSSLREWLNNEFYIHAFDNNQKNKIQITHLINSGGKETDDKIYILSVGEIIKYFGSGGKNFLGFTTMYKNVETRETNYAKNNESSVLNRSSSEDDFWLRTPGRFNWWVAYIQGGHLSTDGIMVNDSSIGVRPALWISN